MLQVEPLLLRDLFDAACNAATPAFSLSPAGMERELHSGAQETPLVERP